MTENTTAPRPQSLADAIERYDNGDFEGCRMLLAAARHHVGEDVPFEIPLFEGLCDRRTGRVESAVALLRQSSEAVPDNPHVLLELGLAIIEAGRTQEGLDVLRQAVHASGDDPEYRHEFYLQNAIALYGEGALEHAVTSLRKSLKFGRDAETYRLLGHMLLEFDKRDEALDAIRAGIEHYPNDAELHHIAGLLLALDREPYQAALAFTRAIELDPRNGGPLHSLGMCFESLNDANRAIEAYERCLRLNVGETVRNDARNRLERLRTMLSA